MADVEETHFSTLAERIAALNKQKNFSSSPAVASAKPLTRPVSSAFPAQAKRPPPPPPPVGAKMRTSPSMAPQAATQTAASTDTPPIRRPQQPNRVPAQGQGPPPSLPQRLPSTQHAKSLAVVASRRPSSESVVSTVSTATAPLALSRVSSATSHGSSGDGMHRLPPAFGTVKLPPLPPSRRDREAAERATAEKEAAEREQVERASRKAAAEREAVAPTTRAPALPMRPGAGSRSASETADADAAPTASPRLPPRPRTGLSAAAAAAAETTTTTVVARLADEPPRPALPARRPTARDDEPPPPVLPTRRPTTRTQEAPAPTLPARRPTVRSALDMGFSSGKPSLSHHPKPIQEGRRGGENGAIERASTSRHHSEDEDPPPPPPPLPMASRPSRAQIDAVVRGGGGRGGAAAVAPSAYAARKSDDEECLLCRDFSGPDGVAARYPLQKLPRQDPVDYLARHICDPFPSDTDKARAIFTWLHHNVAYDVDGFFGGCIPRGQSMSERIFSGKAVCEGYAVIYEAIARAAGLKVRVVTGHGKGFGFGLVKPGQPVPPPNPTGHAWNAVRIDGGEWKLVDACWGAGNVSQSRAERYEKRFTPAMFTMSNEEFGERHFPQDPGCFFRADGRVPTWAEYVVEKSADPPLALYDNEPGQFIGPASVEPSRSVIHVSGSNNNNNNTPDELVHFRFGRSCRHWKLETHGRGLQPYQMVIKISNGGADGRSTEMVEVRYDSPMHWWADIPRSRLGPPGTTLTCFAFVTRDDQDMRGATMADFRASWGRRKVVLAGVCGWTLA